MCNIKVTEKDIDVFEVEYKGHYVCCYGDIIPEDNIFICCDNEIYDDIYHYRNGFNSWEKCVKEIIDHHSNEFPCPVQIEVI